MFAEYGEGAHILHITAYGTPEWIEGRPYATGSGEPFAYALLQKYRGRELELKHGSLLAYKVIEEAIEVGAFGLGPPIQLCRIERTGVAEVTEGEIAALRDAAAQLRESEVDLLFERLADERRGV